MFSRLLLSFSFLFLVSNVFSYKFLVFSPATSKSHLISNGRIADELAKAGHDVTLLEIDFLEIAETTKSAKHAKKLIIGGLENGVHFKNILSSFSSNVFNDRNALAEFQGLWSYQQTYNDLCRELLNRTELFYKLKNEKFDGFFSEQINFCGFGYAQALGIPRKFMISSCPFTSMTYDQTGLPLPSSSVPMSADMGSQPSYFERFENLVNSVLANLAFRYLNIDLDNMYKQHFGEEFPTMYEIVRNVDTVFISTDEILDYSSPTLQNIVNIGGLGVDSDSSMKLDSKYEKEMEKGKNGIILFSLGTIANTSRIPTKVMESVLDIVQQFPDYHFIIRADKYDKNTHEKGRNVKNAFISDWLPQPSILKHPRLKLFITHAGYNSLIESARAGVPLITIPFMFDQNLNSRAVEKKGWGVRRIKQQLLNDPKSIHDAIQQVLTNPIYTEKAHRIRDLILSKPQTASQRFIKTVEWVVTNNGVDELKYEARNMNFIQFYNLDIIFPFVIVPLYFIIPFIFRLYSYSCFGHMYVDKVKKD